MREIRYKAGYKYQLADDYSHQLPADFGPFLPPYPIETPWLRLTSDGLLTILHGYAWDGPSGPTVDTPDSMRGSLLHDALYQMIRLGKLSEHARRSADLLLYRICLEDGMAPLRAKIWYDMVRAFAGPAAHPSAERPVLVAPGPAVAVLPAAVAAGGEA